MSEQNKNLEKLLEPSVTKALQGLVSALRESLLVEASKRAEGNAITEDDLMLAFKALRYPTKDSIQFADAQAVVSQALRENRIIEWVSYAMAVVLFVFGLTLMAAGSLDGDVATRVASIVGGSIVELLILIPFRFAINSRRHNIALRMLGIILNRVDDPKKLAPLLKDTFLSVVLGSPKFEVSSE